MKRSSAEALTQWLGTMHRPKTKITVWVYQDNVPVKYCG